MKKFISYTRVSTQKQGLGLEAQTATIQSYVKAHNGSIIASYSEKESGKETLNRQALQDAIKTAKAEGATLIVAKLDRLSRDIMTIFALKKDTHLTFEVCDIDASDTMTLGIFATLAQKERELISKRTKEALAAKKADGMKLGNPNLVNRTEAGLEQVKKAGQASARKRAAEARSNDVNRHAFAAIDGRKFKDKNGELKDGSLQQYADYLNEAGFITPTGKAWGKMQVKRLLDRYAPLRNLQD